MVDVNRTGRGKITEDEVFELLQLYADGYSQNFVAFRFNIDRSTVRYYIDKYHVVRRNDYKQRMLDKELELPEEYKKSRILKMLRHEDEPLDKDDRRELLILRLSIPLQRIIREEDKAPPIIKKKPKSYLDYLKIEYERRKKEIPKWMVRLHTNKKRKNEMSDL